MGRKTGHETFPAHRANMETAIDSGVRVNMAYGDEPESPTEVSPPITSPTTRSNSRKKKGGRPVIASPTIAVFASLGNNSSAYHGSCHGYHSQKPKLCGKEEGARAVFTPN